jgi:hypothetical protein
MGYASYVAGAAEISVTDGNKIKVHRIVAATDPGYAVNPAQIERQIAGSFVYGLSGLFYGGCTVKDGRIEQSNFDTYNSMRIAEMPKVESIVMPSGGFWGGVGEPTICVAGPAVLNAYFAATGKRIRSVPLRDQNITFALYNARRLLLRAAAPFPDHLAHESAARGNAKIGRWRGRGDRGVAGLAAPRARDGFGTHRRDRRRLCRGGLRPGLEAIRAGARGELGRSQPYLHLLPLQQ